MTREIKNLFITDWEAELEDHEVGTRYENDNEIQVVLLAGLQRLARLGGIVGQRCIIQTPSSSIVQAIFTTRFMVRNEEDGTVEYIEFVGTADCTPRNTSGQFTNYPTAVAESRAEARSLRKALGLFKMLASEEVGLREEFGELEASPDNKADTQLIVAIQSLCESRAIQPVQVLEEVIEDAERAASIFELSELTTDEAQRALEWLNAQKKPEPTTKDKRDARKKELQEKQDNG